jgi:hypothetical protein
MDLTYRPALPIEFKEVGVEDAVDAAAAKYTPAAASPYRTESPRR